MKLKKIISKAISALAIWYEEAMKIEIRDSEGKITGYQYNSMWGGSVFIPIDQLKNNEIDSNNEIESKDEIKTNLYR